MLRRGYPLALPRRGLLAGGYEGVDRVIEFAGRLSGLSGGTHRIELHDVIGNDEHVVALHTTRAERNGRQLDINAVQVFHVRYGKVTEAWTYHTDINPWTNSGPDATPSAGTGR